MFVNCLEGRSTIEESSIVNEDNTELAVVVDVHGGYLPNSTSSNPHHPSRTLKALLS